MGFFFSTFFFFGLIESEHLCSTRVFFFIGKPSASVICKLCVDSELGGPGVRNAGLLALKNRMKSVKNVSKITSAMKMVAASRLKAAQAKMTESRGFWQPFEVHDPSLYEYLPSHTRTAVQLIESFAHWLIFFFFVFMKKKKHTQVLLGDASLSSEGLSKITTIAITSDKGLCGGVNSTITKYTRAMMGMNAGYENSIVCIGDKGRSQLIRVHSDELGLAITDTQKATICFSQVQNDFNEK